MVGWGREACCCYSLAFSGDGDAYRHTHGDARALDWESQHTTHRHAVHCAYAYINIRHTLHVPRTIASRTECSISTTERATQHLHVCCCYCSVHVHTRFSRCSRLAMYRWLCVSFSFGSFCVCAKNRYALIGGRFWLVENDVWRCVVTLRSHPLRLGFGVCEWLCVCVVRCVRA